MEPHVSIHVGLMLEVARRLVVIQVMQIRSELIFGRTTKGPHVLGSNILMFIFICVLLQLYVTAGDHHRCRLIVMK
jgi:hypothetical protein